ncbi:hypothetical protein E2C01_092452 [Portunus trituberculatus]|uniref:Uncharacterized protein n=1 Tax=Portunus trituberculatus TaxID=210409 RepID=A0A5B7JVI0_PORTR|nr:hypothetical protein [Portunus trituberculatus]
MRQASSSPGQEDSTPRRGRTEMGLDAICGQNLTRPAPPSLMHSFCRLLSPPWPWLPHPPVALTKPSTSLHSSERQ